MSLLIRGVIPKLKYLQTLGLKTKNGKIDAADLARMGAEQCLEGAPYGKMKIFKK